MWEDLTFREEHTDSYGLSCSITDIISRQTVEIYLYNELHSIMLDSEFIKLFQILLNADK